MAQHVDLLVDRGGLGDVGIRDRHIGLGLVIVVVGDEIFNGIVGEKFPQLIAKLGRQGLVVGQHQGGSARAGDHIGDRKGFAGAGGAQQGLVALAAIHAPDHGLNGRGLVAFGFVGGVELEVGHRTILSPSGPGQGWSTDPEQTSNPP